MLDRAPESELYPRHLLELDQLGICLCIAPHPDDEVIGCGGLLALLGLRSQICGSVILTRGERAEIDANSRSRSDESNQAAKILGIPSPCILDCGDRKLRYSDSLISIIRSAIETNKVNTLLLPSLSEPHPDHQVAALAGLAAATQTSVCQRILFYEVGSPMHPNCWIDIDSVAQQKWRAIDAFKSQLRLEAYDTMARALAKVRAFGNRKKSDRVDGGMVACAEAFFELDLTEYRRSGPVAALPQWPWVRVRSGVANSPDSLHYVVILIRSMNRPCIHECLASIYAQTYQPIEILVANASRGVHQCLMQWSEQSGLSSGQDAEYRSASKLTVLEKCGENGLSRPVAANKLLEAAKERDRYRYALFLDDDDLIDANHIERMVAALDSHPDAVAAYSGVRVIDELGQTTAIYDLPWSRERLMGINFLPIHAVLFKLVDAMRSDISFNEELPVLEDWDFWIKLSRSGQFVHCPGVSASYRQTLGQSQVSNQGHSNFWKNWHRRLIGDVMHSSTLDEATDILTWHALELESQRLSTIGYRAQLDDANQTIAMLRDELVKYNEKIEQMSNQLSDSVLQQRLEQSEFERSKILNRMQLIEQANEYERELKRVNQALNREASEVVRLQVELNRVSQLAQTNFTTAESLQQELSVAAEKLQGLTNRHIESLNSLAIASLERDKANAHLAIAINSRGWRLLERLRGVLRPIRRWF